MGGCANTWDINVFYRSVNEEFLCTPFFGKKKGKNPLLPPSPFSPHFVCRGFVCRVLPGIPNEPGRNRGWGRPWVLHRGWDRAPGVAAPTQAGIAEQEEGKCSSGHAELPDVLPSRRQSCAVPPPCLSASLVFIPALRGSSSCSWCLPAREGLGSVWDEHGELGPGRGKPAGERGLGGMGVQRLWVRIKTRLLRRHLSISNARDQGKASEQIFLYIPVP